MCLFAQGCSPDWSDAEALAENLDCGISLEKAISVLETQKLSFEESQILSNPEGNYDYPVEVHRGRLWLSFSADGLYAIRATEVVAPTKVFEHPRRNICTGEQTIRTTVVALHDQWLDSWLLVDQRMVGQVVTNTRAFDLELPVGERRIALEQEGKPSSTAILNLTSESSHITVSFGPDGEVTVSSAPERSWWKPRGAQL